MSTQVKSAQHTPAPWVVGHKSEFATHNPNIIFGHDNAAIAECYGIPMHTTLEALDNRSSEGLANACLIATAPELLQALEDLRGAIQEYGLLDVKKRFLLCTADAQAGTAIYKAKGGLL